MKAKIRKDLRDDGCYVNTYQGWLPYDFNDNIFLSHQPYELEDLIYNTVIVANWDIDKPTMLYLVKSEDLEFLDETD